MKNYTMKWMELNQNINRENNTLLDAENQVKREEKQKEIELEL